MSAHCIGLQGGGVGSFASVFSVCIFQGFFDIESVLAGLVVWIMQSYMAQCFVFFLMDNH